MSNELDAKEAPDKNRARMSTSKDLFLLKKKSRKDIIVALFNNSKRPIQNLFELFDLCKPKLCIKRKKKCSVSVFVEHCKVSVHFVYVEQMILNSVNEPDFLLIMHPVDANGQYSLHGFLGVNKIISNFKPTTLHIVNGLAQMDKDKVLIVKKHIKRAMLEKFGDNKLQLIDNDNDVFEFIQSLIYQKNRKNKSKTRSKSKDHRRNIHKLMADKELLTETLLAGEIEEKRKQRISHKQQIYDRINVDKSRMILEFDPHTHEPIVEVAPVLAKQMKSHQVKGIHFMWDSVIESVHKVKEGGSGCILAHSMGLGKTFQAITFLHTILTHRLIKKHIKCALVLCPVNTIKNWISEFRQWLENNGLLEFSLFDFSDSKTQQQRGETLKVWRQQGGVLICGINLFVKLVAPNEKDLKCLKTLRDVIIKAFVDPGPELVVIDEGHVLKNRNTAVNKAVNSISTLRRIILTGTPLQNNLDEYHVMVHFVKPNLLGSKKEFTNRFVNPINNGQHIDSTPDDVELMKKRAYVLHKALDGFVQRFDYSVLKPYLQPKLEFIISIKLTEKQIELYRYYLDHITAKEGSALLADFANLRLIWNHPGLLFSAHHRKEAQAKQHMNKNGFYDSDDELVSGSEFSSSDKETDQFEKDVQGGNQSVENISDNIFKNCWFSSLISYIEKDKLELSSKMQVLFYLLDECVRIGDKVIVFTQSLDTLDFIETCLESRALEMESKGNSFSWRNGTDYFRIDGSVRGDLRKSHIDIFNNPDNLRARLFLLSTKAGGLGINLVGANRCIIFDASWNPTHDVQAIFRIYRFGQTKPVYIYRFIAQGTMEEKIYERQVNKQSLSVRVIDESQVSRHFRAQELQELYKFEPDTRDERPILNVPKDRLLADLIVSHKDLIVKYHEHDSLLENRPEEDLTEDERKRAWNEYEREKDDENYANTNSKKSGNSPIYNNNDYLREMYKIETDIKKLEDWGTKLKSGEINIHNSDFLAAAADAVAAFKGNLKTNVPLIEID